MSFAKLHHQLLPHRDAFDLARGVKTAGRDVLFVERILQGKRHESVHYQPVNEEWFREAIQDVPRWPFYDLGCGKGRGLILAHEAGFPELVGVDFSRPLCRVARVNLRKLNISATILNQDAATVQFPREPIVVFLYNPFGEMTLRKVTANLGDLPCVIVYITPIHERAFKKFDLIRSGDCFRVYRSSNEQRRLRVGKTC